MLLSSLSVAAPPMYERIVQGMAPNSITLIGESHQRPQSVQFFNSLVDSYLQQSQCLTVALEIPSNQQPIINELVRGKAAAAAGIQIAPMIDHPPFLAMIEYLASMHSNGACLELIGIEKDTTRDEWMAVKLAEQVSSTPVLALLGNLHTLKKMEDLG